MAVSRRRQQLFLAVVPTLAAALIRILGATWRVRDCAAPGVPVGDTLPGPTIFAFWHEGLLSCAYRFRDQKIAILISRSSDGELIARTVEKLGFIAVRGSSSRGGATGLRSMEQAFTAGRICAFTVDGPRGPRRVAKAGPVHLARLSGAAWIGCFHAEAERAWRLRSWDRFQVPKPFSVVRFGWSRHVVPELSAVQGGLRAAELLAGD